MSRRCQITGKKPIKGYSYTLRGIAKKKKGIGLKITGKTKRRFLPNIVSKRLWSETENRFVRLKVSIDAIRTIDRLGLEKVMKRAGLCK
ncbi:MAG: 50S ribosomal protein L28 [Victivallaceae bacterium]